MFPTPPLAMHRSAFQTMASLIWSLSLSLHPRFFSEVRPTCSYSTNVHFYSLNQAGILSIHLIENSIVVERRTLDFYFVMYFFWFIQFLGYYCTMEELSRDNGVTDLVNSVWWVLVISDLGRVEICPRATNYKGWNLVIWRWFLVKSLDWGWFF